MTLSSPNPSDAPVAVSPRTTGGFVAVNVLLASVCVVFCAYVSYMRGQDINFDQLNYHYYVAYAYWTHRFSQDVAPAQLIHSFLNPTVYLPFYFLVRHLPPYAVGIVLGGVHGLNLWLVGNIAWIVTRALASRVRIAAVLAAIVISAASPMALSELGTSLADVSISLPVLAGLALLMRAELPDGRARWTGIFRIGLAGALLGAATSLKLTAAAFAIALAVAGLIGWRNNRDRSTAILSIGGGGIAGFIACGGYWYFLMWQLFANPVFPYFNKIFRSPDYQTIQSVFDDRYIPSGLGALLYPFRFIGTRLITSELPFRDIRFALLIVLGVAVYFVRRTRAGQDLMVKSTPAGQRLVVFCIVAFGVWMYEWSIQRYIVALELLIGPAFIVVLQWSGLFRIGRGRALSAVAGICALSCVVTVKAPDWGHLAWAKRWYKVGIPPADNTHAIYFIDNSAPLSYIVPALPADSTAIGILAWENLAAQGNSVFSRRIRALLADPHNDVLRAVTTDTLSDSFIQTMAQYGLRQAGACNVVSARPGPLAWCVLERIPPNG